MDTFLVCVKNKGMKLEIVVDASRLPVGVAAAAAKGSECNLAIPAFEDVPVAIPKGTPVLAD
jgi:hypothetical protein